MGATRDGNDVVIHTQQSDIAQVGFKIILTTTGQKSTTTQDPITVTAETTVNYVDECADPAKSSLEGALSLYDMETSVNRVDSETEYDNNGVPVLDNDNVFDLYQRLIETTTVKPTLNLADPAKWSMSVCGDIGVRLEDNADTTLLSQFITLTYIYQGPGEQKYLTVSPTSSD